MVRSTNNVWLHRFACALAFATLLLVGLGGVVTTKGVGMAVPDWPTTYGDHMFFFPPSKWMAGIFDEHSHRLWASLVGMLAAAFAIWVWVRDSAGRQRLVGVAAMIAGLGLMGVRTPGVFVIVACVCVGVIAYAIPRAIRDSKRLRWLGVIVFAAVIIQGVLGGLRVLLDEHGWGTEFGIFHALLAQLFFLFVCSLALITSKWWQRANTNELNAATASRLKTAFLATTVLIFVQLLFGATMRHQHQGLAVPDLPLAYGKLWPATDVASVELYNAHRLEAAGEQPISAFHINVHMLHRYTGVVALLAIGACAVIAWRNTRAGSTLRKVSLAWVAVGLIQVALGILSILSQRKVDLTTAHVAVGALTFLLG
ncbi:MAG TPA: COX15/CtaA family protein, partial [Candidatus Limnocylindria bacterium]|nr:COX15/CtaA family protein [Candidatus Limnocylindria bacterium]